MSYYQASRADPSFCGSARPLFAYQKATNVTPLRGNFDPAKATNIAPLRGNFESANSEFTLN
jgi:hypothetical protein